MTAENLLARLEGVKQTAAGRWLARCPAHEDRRPSLSIREADDGRTLVHCFGGCGADAVLSAVGLGMADLFPDRVAFERHQRPRVLRVPAADILIAIADEVWIAAIAASDLAAGVALPQQDRARLALAAERLSAAVEVSRAR